MLFRFGFIVMDGNGALFGTLQGNTRDVLHKFTVDLPKKHGRGGQSALRFARLRMEKRHNYVRKVAETAVQMFISNDKPNISGMILAGSADFKTELSQSDMFDPRLQVSTLSQQPPFIGKVVCSMSEKQTSNNPALVVVFTYLLKNLLHTLFCWGLTPQFHKTNAFTVHTAQAALVN